MAGDWIKMNKSLTRDPRVVRISSALNADRLRTVGGLFSVWCLADELTSDGMLDAYTPELLDEVAGLPGISQAMASVGWLVIGDGFLEFPRFERHNGQSSKRRAQEAVRKMSARNADKCPDSSQTKCGPEKRREEKKRNNEESLFEEEQEPSKNNPKQKITWDEENGFVGITDSNKAAWFKAYPKIDIMQEIDKMHVWLTDHPERRKKNYPAFISNWLSNAKPSQTQLDRSSDGMAEKFYVPREKKPRASDDDIMEIQKQLTGL